eukprot:CAMPEP_0181209168 /NCGR_PEP_ID=MMETSP1096-20121128/22517_1 /TAXON_ID=156174 ORGANISM="Chrysochromulina ericina, Strain CCMP281" /NCGR_SAMPLE_ID=MMETSP1096 /ASSEMBLY_ACC=CAM_ASM_000453 /LENGTH=128 /DNA_ID=CAMNT_0023300301 /DNA_START=500 /DNA_END=887 /DNA_ORIENTATION=-
MSRIKHHRAQIDERCPTTRGLRQAVTFSDASESSRRAQCHYSRRHPVHYKLVEPYQACPLLIWASASPPPPPLVMALWNAQPPSTTAAINANNARENRQYDEEPSGVVIDLLIPQLKAGVRRTACLQQ